MLPLLYIISLPAPPAPSIPRTAAPTAFHSPLSARLSPPGTARRCGRGRLSGSDCWNPGVGDAGLGHAPVYLGQLVRCHHHVQVPVPFPPCRQRSSRSRLRFGAGGSFTLSSSFSSGLWGRGEGGRLFSMPSSMFPFCSSVSSAVNKGLSLPFIGPPICPHGTSLFSVSPVPLAVPPFWPPPSAAW